MNTPEASLASLIEVARPLYRTTAAARACGQLMADYRNGRDYGR